MWRRQRVTETWLTQLKGRPQIRSIYYQKYSVTTYTFSSKDVWVGSLMRTNHKLPRIQRASVAVTEQWWSFLTTHYVRGEWRCNKSEPGGSHRSHGSHGSCFSASCYVIVSERCDDGDQPVQPGQQGAVNAFKRDSLTVNTFAAEGLAAVITLLFRIESFAGSAFRGLCK